MARPIPNDRREVPVNGASAARQKRVDRAVEDEQTIADGEQTLSDADQTLSDADQSGSDSDQASADEDQLAADRDQAASDRELEHGADRRVHDLSQDVRQKSAREREHTAEDRDRIAVVRLGFADQRDASADDRDRAAAERDHRAEARNVAMAKLDAACERNDGKRALTGVDLIARAAGQRRRAAQRRVLAAEQRELAAQDRRDAAQDRAQAARERLDLIEQRELLADDLQRETALRNEALHHQHRAEKLARTLQRSLSPPRLPRIAGLDVAVHYEPSAPEEVGGDFYDLFPLSITRTGFFLGDVCGKGPDAAAVTSLARYTMRTAALLRETPAAILMDLNAALLMESAESMQTCTAVYGQLDMNNGTVAITLAVAGHPPPLIIRAGGSVQTTLAHGTLLGAVSTPAFVTCEVHLAPGDAIVICSDGIHDSEIDAVRVDEQRVLELLSGTPQASAQALVDRLLQALRRTPRPLRDDVAILALRHAPR